MLFGNIVHGSLRSRRTDKFGSGQFHAGRSMGKTRHTHQGLDIEAKPNEQIFSPINGEIIREASPYPPFTELLIRGTGDHVGYQAKLFYVKGYACGSVRMGDLIGTAEDLSVKYPGITNHVHLEIKNGGFVVDPLDIYQMSF